MRASGVRDDVLSSLALNHAPRGGMTLTTSGARLTLRSLALRRPAAADYAGALVDDPNYARAIHEERRYAPSSCAAPATQPWYGEWVGAATAAVVHSPRGTEQQRAKTITQNVFSSSAPSRSLFSSSASTSGNTATHSGTVIARAEAGLTQQQQQQQHTQRPWLVAAAGFATALGGHRRTSTTSTIPRPRLGNTIQNQRTGSGASSGSGGGGGGGGSSDGRGNPTRHVGDRILRTPRARMIDLRNPTCAQDILSIVGNSLREMTPTCVGVAFNRLGKMAKSRDFSPPSRRFQKISEDATFIGLMHLTRNFAESGCLQGTDMAVTLNGIAKLHEAKRLDALNTSMAGALGALENAAARAAPALKPQEVSMTMWAYAKLGAPGQDTWRALDDAVVRVAPNATSQGVTNTFWAYATLERMPRDEVWGALDAAAEREAKELKPQEVSNLLWAYATLGKAPSRKTLEALDAAAARVAPEMISQAVANTMWACSKLQWHPNKDTWAALATAARREARGMNPQNLSNTLYAYTRLAVEPDAPTWAALESVAERLARQMNQQEITCTMFAFAAFKRMPEDVTWATFDAEVRRLAPSMTAQSVTTVLSAYATLGRVPEGKTWTALDGAVGRTVHSVIDTPTTLWAYAVLYALRDIDHPSRYAAVWDMVCRADAKEFDDIALGQLFHASLLHRFLPSSLRTHVAYPPWLMVEARDVWRRGLAHVSSHAHLQLVRVIDDLGFQYEVERVTDDGHFSMDIYLPEYDVAVEFDGPTHYISSGSTSPDGSRTRTAKTEIRNLCLATQCVKVVTVPYFEFDNCNTTEERRAYVHSKLVSACVGVTCKGTTTSDDAGFHHGAAPSDGASPSSTEKLSDGASVESALAHVGDTYLSLLPTQKRASLAATSSAAVTPAAKWALVVACAEADTTKVRAVTRIAVLEANAALLRTHITSL